MQLPPIFKREYDFRSFDSSQSFLGEIDLFLYFHILRLNLIEGLSKVPKFKTVYNIIWLPFNCVMTKEIENAKEENIDL